MKTATVPNWTSLMSPVENQNENENGPLCGVYAACAVLEGLLHMQNGSINCGIDLDEWHLKYQGLQTAGQVFN